MARIKCAACLQWFDASEEICGECAEDEEIVDSAIFADRWRCAWAVVGEAVALRPGGAGVELLNWKIGDDPIDWNDVYDRARAWLDANRGTK